MRLEFNVLYFLKLELIPVKNESNVVVLFICTFRDITSFKVDGRYIFVCNTFALKIFFMNCVKVTI